MRANVYVVLTNEGWQAGLTIHSGVDYAYWFEDAFGRGDAAVAWYWREALSFGEACGFAERWRREAEGKKGSEAWALERMAWFIDGEKRSGSGRENRRDRSRVRKSATGGMQGRAERWTGAKLGQRARSHGMSGAERAKLAAQAKLAAELLQGRALLGSEARALLGAHGPADDASWSAAIQLASLQGRVRLSGAVAADRGGRPDAAARRSRCLRCGSGEARLQRTHCEACGRECAYCEACLTMGRSRECEMLIVGVYQPHVGTQRGPEQPLEPAATRLRRWGLSPAQTAAASKALSFVENKPQGGKNKERNAMNMSKRGVIWRKMWKSGQRNGDTYSWNSDRGENRSIQQDGDSLQRNKLTGTSRWPGLVLDSGAAEGGAGIAQGIRQALSRGRSRTLQPIMAYETGPLGGADDGQSLVRIHAGQLSEGNGVYMGDSVKGVGASGDGTRVLEHRMMEKQQIGGIFNRLHNKTNRPFLLWAVTGAGKTEMIFPLVESVLRRNGKVLIASPRRDVVIELDPRIRKAFPDASVVTLYGGSGQKWEQGQITLSTTHQLFRFQEAFDLVIVDEIDAYPYHGDPMLYYGADKCCLPGAPKLLLSATPPKELQREAKRGRLEHARVPVRYHRHPLPLPRLLRSPKTQELLSTGKLPATLLALLRSSLERGAQIFLFVSRISHAEPLAKLFMRKLGTSLIEATSSQDAERAEKVKRFRAGDCRILVTTTILERGVTIPKSDVFILDADSSLFDEASLVQMAGRAGRSADDPDGKVYFFASERNSSQLQARSHIRTMNTIARKQGFLLPGTSRKEKR